jgi:segregation and condensation protein B
MNDHETPAETDPEAPEAAGDGAETPPDADAPAETPPEEADAAFPIENVVEAILFAARSPLKASQIARCAGDGIGPAAVREAIETLNRLYEEAGRAFEIYEVAERFHFHSRPEYAPYIQRLFGAKVEKDRRLTPAALDTLSIVAYKQPITRAEIETIRGVGCGPVLRHLIEMGLVAVCGRKTEALGTPPLYGTTEEFLKEFGLATLQELPMIEEMREATGTTEPIPPVPAGASPDADDRDEDADPGDAADPDEAEADDDDEAEEDGEAFDEDEDDEDEAEEDEGEEDEGEDAEEDDADDPRH